jgi:hypothetical protein
MQARSVRAALLSAVVAATFGAAPAIAQESKSAPLARELRQLLESAKLDSIAAPDPANGKFVAALYIPGTQLLVVSGKFESTEIGPYRISNKEFRELYMDLMGGSVAGSKVIASDISADGLVFKPSNGVPGDSWEHGAKNMAFEGAKKAKLKDEEYHKAYSDADTEYARMLALLIQQAKAEGGN